MDGSLGKRLFWIVIILGLSIWSVVSQEPVLGLDLQGGVTMRYRLEAPEGAVGETEEQKISRMDSATDTLRSRLDTFGIREMSITRQGTDEIVIELPGRGKEEADTIKSLVSRVGHLELRMANVDDPARGVSVGEQRDRLTELLALPENFGRLPNEISVASLDMTFDDVVYRWIPFSDRVLADNRRTEGQPPKALDELIDESGTLPAGSELTADDYLFVKLETSPNRIFTGTDILDAYPTLDETNQGAVGISMKPSRAGDFEDFTTEGVNNPMAILLDGRVAESPATINEPLRDSFIIKSGRYGGFSQDEIKGYRTIVKSGSLQMKPQLLFENTIGPSLGEASITAGYNASIAALIAIILFMLVYYRIHGVIAVVTLLLNLLMLTAILMAIKATITLPGLAGLVLTLGMAVDANILVFERLREEADRSKSLEQAVKLGFDKAFSTILDANITTFVTAFILYKVGTGPVRGFSVVLMIGILTSVFSVLVIGRSLYDLVLSKGKLASATMGRLISSDTNIAFMSKTRMATRVSVFAIVLSIIAFTVSDDDKYGLDFRGGYKGQIVLAEAASQPQVKGAVDTVFPGAQIISVSDGKSESGKTTQFVVKIKATGDEGEVNEDVDLQERYELPLKRALGSMILSDFATDVSVSPNEATQVTSIAATAHFLDPVKPDAVSKALGGAFGDLIVEQAGPKAVTVTGSVPRVGITEQFVVQTLSTSLREAAGVPKLSEPFLESSTIGGKVGTELRDSAIRAILLSFIAIVLYIRVRFSEYSYGYAAIAALAHDVIIALGVVSAVHYLGIVDVEIDLAMIAAFLTIIGYSLNDTIVLFDRVRENIPRLKKPLGEVLNISINQTLARTLLTSLTTFIALVVIFVFNLGKQNVLEGFSFAMMIGVVVGTYSSMFVAAPVLRMLEERSARAKAR